MFCNHSWLRESHDDITISLICANWVWNYSVDSDNMKNMPTSAIRKGMSVAWKISKENMGVLFRSPE